ncbi:MAG TPA: GspE/PulE family protein [Candidatus Paceibacterota bacterium]|nr:GspE/PulE family protein [Candidatus Paceibacterota bacterium]HOL53904.1 GspE/PulE family protein [Candidatus Paceibacterota bacterium]HON21604.1 GspE/PulE family protein [Candidatus Paceibacterota bacterium]HOV88525.1 GspE/PulE family protein [Candidatus Paceibacterota bacterium]HPP16794.1 GspE/PulE family protein [Candidatus Paceibacterota bacterium]
MPLRLPEDKLKEFLVDSGLVSPEAFQLAQEDAKRTGQEVIDILISRGFISEDYIYQFYSDYFKTPFIKLRGRLIKKAILSLLPEEIARLRRVAIFDKDEKGFVYLAMEDPGDLETINFVQKYVNAPVKVFLTTAKDLNYVYSLYGKEVVEDFKKVVEDNLKETARLKMMGEKEVAEEMPIVNIVDAILAYAISLNASDIHIEVLQDVVLIRFRIDGVLHEMLRIPKEVHPAIVARIKILAGLKIDEHRKPQDGRMRYEALGEAMDIRVSIMPTFYGEKVEMRLLRATAKPMSFRELGMLDDTVQIVEDSIKKTYGMLLVTGPTGSGKTTTLYSILNMLNKPDVNIVTIEDPIEYYIRYVNQTQINPQAGITFATGLRAILRQDPNIIMIGEIRDEETAEIAVHSALTGHLVLSSLHTNDAPTAIPRLIDMKVPAFLVAAVLNTVIAQRLVRRICKDCIESYTPDVDTIESLKKQLQDIGGEEVEIPKILYRGAGCPICNYSGYRSQVGIFEVLSLDEDMRRLVNKPDFSLDALRNMAKQKGMVTMLEDGLRKAQLGITTVEEVLRVIRE